MLEVVVYRDAVNRIAGFLARGHADFADHGQDIVCAGVSAVLQAARLGLEVYLGAHLIARQRAGQLRLTWSEGHRDLEAVRAIATTAEIAVEQIAHRYPEHVRLRRRRVSRDLGEPASGRVTRLADRRRMHNV